MNPLEGAPTDVNTIIFMNKVPKATFEQVVTDAIIAKETELSGTSTTWGSKGEHIKWDFGAPNLGCVLIIQGTQKYDQWAKKQGVEVVIQALLTTDPDKPVYQVIHLHDCF